MSLAARAIDLLLGLYARLISPFLPRSCRYEPTCSAYARDAVRTYGALRGSVLALRRIGRCHPWAPGGIDRVPPRAEAR